MDSRNNNSHGKVKKYGGGLHISNIEVDSISKRKQVEELRKYGSIWKITFPINNKEIVIVIYENWEDAKKARDELNGKVVSRRIMEVEWLRNDWGVRIVEGSGDFGIENKPPKKIGF